MKLKRTIIIPVLALSSVLGTTAVSLAATSAPAVAGSAAYVHNDAHPAPGHLIGDDMLYDG